jgi:hypothetical protein
MHASSVLDSFKSQQEDLISSFAHAFSKVAVDSPARNRFVGSLATALNSLTASAASSIVSVAAGGPDTFSKNAKAFQASLGKQAAQLLDKAGAPSGPLSELKSEQQALIASFAGALGHVANDRLQTQRLQASLAAALTALTASASNAIVAVGNDGGTFKTNAGKFRAKLSDRLKSLVGA